jgi:small-conductance mechanosensitive channel
MSNEPDSITSYFNTFLQALSRPIFELSGSKISVSSLLISIVIFFVFVKVAKIVQHSLVRFLSAKDVDPGLRDSLGRFSHYLIVGVGALTALDSVGFSIKSLAGLGAILMVGIGFGLQNIAQNFISGIILLIERPVKVGDIIQVGSVSGRVTDIRVRSTVVQTRDDVSIIVPNSKLISEEVINDSFSGQRIRQHVRVGVAYGSDLALVKRVLLEIAAQHPQILKDPLPSVVFKDFGDSSQDFDLRCWCMDIWNIDSITSDLRFAIEREFKAFGIQIPFPQRDVRLIGKLPV